jgi:mono/diheme cytochrome c family protein
VINRVRVITRLAAATFTSASLFMTTVGAQVQGAPVQAGRGGGRGAVTTPAPAPTSPVTGSATIGKKLYYDYSCYACHGFNGETGARAFVPSWTPMLATEGSFIAFLRGRADQAPATPSTGMPNYAATTLSDAQAKDIYAYIRGFKGAQPAVEQIPTFAEILKAAERPYKP